MRARLIVLIAALLAIWPGAVMAADGGVTHRNLTEVSLSSNPIVPGGLSDWAAVQNHFRNGRAQNSLLALRGRWLAGQTEASIEEHRRVVYWLADRVLKAKTAADAGAELATVTASGTGNGPFQPMIGGTTADLYGMTFAGRNTLMACMGRVVFVREGEWKAWIVPVRLPDGRMFSLAIWQDCGNMSLVLGTKPERVEVPGPERRVEVQVPGPERVRTEYVPVEVPGPERVREVEVKVPVYVTEYRDREVMVKVPVEVPGPERTVYRDRLCAAEPCATRPTLTGPRGTTAGTMLRSGWGEPTYRDLVTMGIILMPGREPAPAPGQTDVPCPPGGEPNPGTLPPGTNPPPPPTVPVPLEPNPPGPPPVTGPGSGGEVGTNTPPPSTPDPGNSTVPGNIPNTPPDTTGLLPAGRRP